MLRFAAPYADDAFYTELGATLGKLKDNEAKTDIVNYLGNQGAKTALPAILPYLKDADAELSEAAMWAATQIGGSEVPAALSEVILTATDSEHDQARANTAAQCLLAYKGNVNPVAAEIVQKKGDVRGITVLAARRAQDQSGVVFDATRMPMPPSHWAVYAALPAVASAKDLPALYTMLEKQQSVNDQNTEAIQNAIVAALREPTPTNRPERSATASPKAEPRNRCTTPFWRKQGCRTQWKLSRKASTAVRPSTRTTRSMRY